MSTEPVPPSVVDTLAEEDPLGLLPSNPQTATPEPEKPWTIGDRAEATWAGRVSQQAAASIEAHRTLFAHQLSMIEASRKDLDDWFARVTKDDRDTIARMEGALLRFAEEETDAELRTVDLPSVVLTVRKAPDTIEVSDDESFAEWAEEEGRTDLLNPPKVRTPAKRPLAKVGQRAEPFLALDPPAAFVELAATTEGVTHPEGRPDVFLAVDLTTRRVEWAAAVHGGRALCLDGGTMLDEEDWQELHPDDLIEFVAPAEVETPGVEEIGPGEAGLYLIPYARHVVGEDKYGVAIRPVATEESLASVDDLD